MSLGEGKIVHAHWTNGPEVDQYDKIGLKYIGWAWPPFGSKIVKEGLNVMATCPVDLMVNDPDGLVVSKMSNQIPEAVYLQDDLNGDGLPDDYVLIPELKTGKYLVRVIPEPGAPSTAIYSLEVWSIDMTIVLAKNVQISDIPTQPYIVRSTETAITAWDYFFEDSTRGTKLYLNATNQTFQFIAPGKEFPIKKATRMKIIDFSKGKDLPVKYDSSDKKWKLDGKKLDLDDDLKLFAEQHQFNQRPDKIILINHKDGDLQLSAVVVDGKEDSCVAIARDLKTKKVYLLMVKPDLKRHKK